MASVLKEADKGVRLSIKLIEGISNFVINKYINVKQKAENEMFSISMFLDYLYKQNNGLFLFHKFLFS